MSQDEITKDEFDTELTRLFAEKSEPLPNHAFMQQVLSRLQREYRMRQVRRWCMVAVVIMLVIAITPGVVRVTSGLLSLTGYVSRVPGMNTISMLGMVLVSAIMIYRTRQRI